MAFAAGAHAIPIIDEGFDGGGVPGGWAVGYFGDAGGTTGWFQGNSGVFGAHAGAAESYIAANFLNTGPGGTIDSWLATPEVALTNGSTFTFYTRSNNSDFPDRLELRLCASGACFIIAEYTTVLATINPALAIGGYPGDWTGYTLTLSGLASGVTGRFAFRYFVTDTNVNGDYIGIDSVLYNLNVPEPGTLGLMLLAVVLVIVLRRRAHSR
jgi:hypothetical protein